MRYEYRNGYGVKGVKPDDAHRELQRIREKRGLSPSAIVEESKPKDAVLHPAFEWSDKKAAHEYRLQQARQVARAVVIVSDDEKQRSPAFVHVNVADGEDGDQREGRYEPIDVVVSEPDLFEAALSELRGKLRAAADAVHALERAAKTSNDPDKMVKISLAVKALDAAQSAIDALH